MPFNNIESTKWNSTENDDGMFCFYYLLIFFFFIFYFFVIQSVSVLYNKHN